MGQPSRLAEAYLEGQLLLADTADEGCTAEIAVGTLTRMDKRQRLLRQIDMPGGLQVSLLERRKVGRRVGGEQCSTEPLSG